MNSYSSVSKSLAVFTGVLAVFVYLILADSIGISADTFRISMLSALFNYALSVEAVVTILARSVLVFLGVFSVTWLATAILQKKKA